MKFKTTTRELKKHISAVSRAVDMKPTTPALQGIYMKALGEFCEFVGSDLDLVIKSRLKMEVLVGGECLINARVLSDVVRKLPRGEVVFQILGSELRVEQNKQILP